MARQDSANAIINRVALEVGLTPVSDPVSDPDEAFVQLTGLLTVAGQELVELHPWQVLIDNYSFTTVVPADTGIYDLPDDFCYMIEQTGWDKTSNVPLVGPLSSQDWAYLEGRNLVSQTIYASFKQQENKLYLYPQPPPNGLQVSFDYIRRTWCRNTGSADLDQEEIIAGSDVIAFEPILIQKFLKAKFLEAKGFDAGSARLEFENIFNSRTGKDEGAAVLNAAGTSRRFPYIDPLYNVGDTNYGVQN
jgi:hypothetical protein